MKWNKIAHVFDPTVWNDGFDRPWMKTHSQCASTLVYDNFVRVFFSCRPENDKEGQATSYTTYADLDRENLTKVINVSKSPVLPLGKLGTFDENAVYPTSTIRHNNKVLLYYAGWSRCKSVPFNTSIGLATSSNGEQFERLGMGPIISHSVRAFCG